MPASIAADGRLFGSRTAKRRDAESANEQEQKGKDRAAYGKEILKSLAERLTAEFGRGFSQTNLKLMRQFYVQNQHRIGQPLTDQSRKSGTTRPTPSPASLAFGSPTLPSRHHLPLTTIPTPAV